MRSSRRRIAKRVQKQKTEVFNPYKNGAGVLGENSKDTPEISDALTGSLTPGIVKQIEVNKWKRSTEKARTSNVT